MGDNLSRMPHQINQEVEFFRSEPHVAVANVHRMRVEIDVKNASIDLAAFRWRFFWDSTQMCSHSCQQLVGVERLCHIVVSARIESLDFDSLLVTDRENNNRDLRRSAHTASKLNAI